MSLWFGSSRETDTKITDAFGPTLEKLATDATHLDEWKTSHDGQLAYILLQDQFSRNGKQREDRWLTCKFSFRFN